MPKNTFHSPSPKVTVTFRLDPKAIKHNRETAPVLCCITLSTKGLLYEIPESEKQSTFSLGRNIAPAYWEKKRVGDRIEYLKGTTKIVKEMRAILKSVTNLVGKTIPKQIEEETGYPINSANQVKVYSKKALGLDQESKAEEKNRKPQGIDPSSLASRVDEYFDKVRKLEMKKEASIRIDKTRLNAFIEWVKQGHNPMLLTPEFVNEQSAEDYFIWLVKRKGLSNQVAKEYLGAVETMITVLRLKSKAPGIDFSSAFLRKMYHGFLSNPKKQKLLAEAEQIQALYIAANAQGNPCGLSEKQRFAVNLFVLLCLTGARFNDMFFLKRNFEIEIRMQTLEDGTAIPIKLLHYISRKTEARTGVKHITVFLPSLAEKILKMYQSHDSTVAQQDGKNTVYHPNCALPLPKNASILTQNLKIASAKIALDLSKQGKHLLMKRYPGRQVFQLRQLINLEERSFSEAISIHAARHYFATYIARKTNEETAQKLLGHSNQATTKDFYIHENRVETALMIGGLFTNDGEDSFGFEMTA